MFTSQFHVYLGAESETGFAGFISEERFSCILDCESGLEHDRGREILKKLAFLVNEKLPNTLAELENIVTSEIKEYNIPLSFSLALCFRTTDGRLLIHTDNIGVIYIKRSGQTAKVITGTKGATGYIEDNDFVFLTTQKLVSHFHDEHEFISLLNRGDSAMIIDAITPRLKEGDDTDLIALALLFSQEEVVQEQEVAEFVSKPQFVESMHSIVLKIKSKLAVIFSNKKKAVTFVIVGFLIMVFFWSTGLGYLRKSSESDQKKIAYATELITGKLQQAEEVAFLNQARATALINDAKKDLLKLREDVKSSSTSEFKKLEALIQEKEGAMLKKEKKSHQEFYDLSLENKSAKGVLFANDGVSSAILDANGAVYAFSLEKKSFESYEVGNADQIQSISVQNDEIFFHKKNTGIFKVGTDGKIKKVIENDKDWGVISGMNNFNNNLYVLDSSKNAIYKYIPVEDGFSEKSTYFKSPLELQEAVSFAIDGSVYITDGGSVLKYTSGLRDGFAPVFPEKNMYINKVITSQEEEKVYAWDKKRGSIYIINKDGDYERQVGSAVFTQANDLIVNGTKAYVLVNKKIFSVGLD
ncbi:MAG: hypothetical protein AAB966_02915 [Patescibacteria group bacterium]